MLPRVDGYLATNVSGDIGRLTFQDGTSGLFRNVGNQRCVTSQKSENVIYTAAEAWNNAYQRTEYTTPSVGWK